jgi:hypothetical protein
MKWTCVLLVFLLVGSVSARADQRAPIIRVRALDPWAIESYERVVAKSALARRMLDQLQASDLIVHIISVTGLPSNLAGATVFVARQGLHRYVRVSLDRTLLPETRAAMLGHELQHALETPSSDAADNDAVRRLYETIGRRVGARDHFETAAATATGTSGRRARTGSGRAVICRASRDWKLPPGNGGWPASIS